MTNNEDYILGQIMFYESLQWQLPKLNPEWFENPLNQTLVRELTKSYLENHGANAQALIGKIPSSELVRAVQLQQNVHGIAKIDVHIIQLQEKYHKTRLIDNLTKLDTQKDLKELIQELTEIADMAQISITQNAESILTINNRVVDRIIDSIKRGEGMSGRKTGWISLDRVLGGYNKGDLIVVAGRPGMGKTALALTLTKDFANMGGKALFLSLEMGSEQLSQRYLSLIGDIANYKIRNGILNESEQNKLCEIVNAPQSEFWVDQQGDLTINDLKGKAKMHKAKHGLELLVIDYIQLIKGTKQVREQEVAEISRSLKLLAKELECTVMVLAQLSRKTEDRSVKRPLLSDLRESGAIEQDADIIMFPLRPAYYEEIKPEIEDAELIIAKNRNGECKTIPTQYIGNRTMYQENIAPKPQNPFTF